MPEKTRPRGPGLAKTRAAPLLRRRTLYLVATSDGALRDLFERADIVSEGEARREGDVLVYYGTTSLLLRDLEVPIHVALARAVALDPHVRVRALRIARREAAARAGGPLGTLHAELTFPEPPGAGRVVALTIDVAAVVLQQARARGARDR